MDSVKFALGDVVYLKIRPDEPGMIVGIEFRPNGIRYCVTWGNAGEYIHYDIELTKTKTFSESVAP